MGYRVDLKKFLAECEANYLRLGKLLPDLDQRDSHKLAMSSFSDAVVEFNVLERTPYTTLIEIFQESATKKPALAWTQLPKLKVRLYHDARMAEVVNYGGVNRIHPRYQYPNNEMHQPNEKAQWNQFLADWLAQVLNNGYVVDVHCEFAE